MEGGDFEYRRAQILRLSGEAERAQATLANAVSMVFTDPLIKIALLLELATDCEQQGELEAAFDYARQAREVNPRHDLSSVATERLGMAVLRQRIDNTSSQPPSVERTLNLSRLYRECGEYQQAIEVLQAAAGEGLRDQAIQLEMAECFQASGQTTIARRAYVDLLQDLESGESNPELELRAHYGLARVEEQLGNPDGAILHLEELVLIRHDYLDTRQRLAELYQLKKGGTTPHADKPIETTHESSDDIVRDILSLLSDDVNPDENL